MQLADQPHLGVLPSNARQGSERDRREHFGVFVSGANEGSSELVSDGVLLSGAKQGSKRERT